MTGWDAIYNKAVKGKFKLTAQKAFENEVKLRGYTYLLWRSAKDAEAFVKSFKSEAGCSNNEGMAQPQSLNPLALLRQEV